MSSNPKLLLSEGEFFDLTTPVHQALTTILQSNITYYKVKAKIAGKHGLNENEIIEH